MSKSHTNTDAAGASASGSDLRIVPGLGLVDLADSGLPQSLAGKVSAELELFADRMRHGLLAAATVPGVPPCD